MALLTLVKDIIVAGSRWIAAHNHIIFGLQAYSDEISSCTDLNGFCRLFAEAGSGSVLDSAHQVGAEIIFNSPPQYNYVKGTITALSGTWYFDTDIQFKAVKSDGGYTMSTVINIVEAFIFDARTNETIKSLYFPDGKGLLNANIAAFALNRLYLSKMFDYSQPSHIDEGKDAILRVTFALTQIRDGNGLSYTPLDPAYALAVKGARQLGEINGANYRENVMDNAGEAKFLNDFKEPSAWEGYPFSLSFIYEKIEGQIFDTFITRHIEQFDINGQILGSNVINLDPTHESFLCLLTFQDEVIQENTNFIETWIADDDEALPAAGYWNIFDQPSYAAGGYVEGNI
jgi:hypothetical protein